MARLPRLVIAGLPHVVSLQVQHEQTLAHDDADREALLLRLRASAQEHGVAVHAFAFDDAGLDLLVSPPQPLALGRFMQSIARRHAAAFNRRHARHGSLWAGRYRTAAVEPQAWMLRCMRWVESRARRSATQAPAHVSAVMQSSEPHHTGTAVAGWLADPPAYWALGNTPFERELVYRQWLHAPADPADADKIESALRGGWFLGDASFLRTFLPQPARAVAPRAPGRPPAASSKLSPKF